MGARQMNRRIQKSRAIQFHKLATYEQRLGNIPVIWVRSRTVKKKLAKPGSTL